MNRFGLQYGQLCLVKVGRRLEMVTLVEKADGGWRATVESGRDIMWIRVPFEDILADNLETLVTVRVVAENFEWAPLASPPVQYGPGKLVMVPARVAVQYGRQGQLEAAV